MCIRDSGLAGLTLFGLTYMTAITVFTTYGFANFASDGHLPASYIAAAVAMIFTALSYGAMVRKYPVAGSAYTYTQQSFGGAVGFLTGWAMPVSYTHLDVYKRQGSIRAAMRPPGAPCVLLQLLRECARSSRARRGRSDVYKRQR